jgi:hypothetical protein
LLLLVYTSYHHSNTNCHHEAVYYASNTSNPYLQSITKSYHSLANAARSPPRVVSRSSPASVTGILSPSLDFTPSILQPISFVISSAGLYPSRSRPSRRFCTSWYPGAACPSERHSTTVKAWPSRVEVCCKQVCSRVLCLGNQPRSRQTVQGYISATPFDALVPGELTDTTQAG